MLKTIQKHIQKRVEKHIQKHQHKHVHRIIHTIHHFHNTLMHMGELIVVGVIGFSSLIFANYNTSYENFRRTNADEIIQYLVKAIAQEQPEKNQSKIISMREMDGNVDNTFAPGYCTYGAARISPEFFPYINSGHNQQRTWGGNAIDRCENAQAAGYKVSSIPVEGSFLVYKPGKGISYFGHVGKVMYYNSDFKTIIIREMNYIDKYIMTDRREDSENSGIKCFIYPKSVSGSNNKDFVSETLIGTKPVEKPVTPNTTPTNITPTPTPIITTPTNNTDNEDPTDSTNTTDTTTTSEPTQQTTETNTDSHNSANTETNIPKETTTTQEISINTSELSDIAQHFFSQNKIEVKKISNNTPVVGEKIRLIISIKNKETGENYEGILPFILNIITNNNNLESNISTIQLINNGSTEIIFTTKEKGDSSIILTIDDQKIASLPISIN